MKKNSIILSETQLHDMIKESVRRFINEYATGAEYDSSAPWREDEREPNVDYAEAEAEDRYRRIESGDYDGFEIVDERGNILKSVMGGDAKAFNAAKQYAESVADTVENPPVSIYGVFDGLHYDEVGVDFLWDAEMGYNKQMKLPWGVNESIKLTQTQFHNMIKESVKRVLNELASMPAVGELRKMIVSEIDYLYNEGVVDYDDEHLQAIVNGEADPDYMDIARATYEDYKGGQFASPEALEILKSFISGNPEHESVVIGAIDDAIDNFVE